MFFLPYKDDNPTRSTPIVNWLLIIANIWVFFTWQFPLGPKEQAAYFSSFGFIPATFFGQFFYPSVEGIIWEWYSVVTSMFSHGGVAHLFGNMLFLYLYGDNMEDALGKLRYLIFYLGCGLLAALAQAFLNPASQIPMVGASGAISGVIGGYLLLYPKANIRVFYWIILFIGTMMVPAYLVLGIWLLEQVLLFPESMKNAGGVAIAAHLGGFAGGFILTPLLKKKEIKFFQDGYSRPFSRKNMRIR
ncbi:MAG: rhomboid family intramembrane serine protease [Verrucomicrobiota bacterium]|nr:rhomboid family intramembrane serine protease [Verrucomicrobiota bacterium]